MKSALITGGSGFVGRHLIPKLVALGYAVCNIDPSSDVPLKAEAFIEREYRNGFTPWDLIVHLAANIEDVNVRVRGGVEMYQDMVLDYEVAKYCERNPPKQCVVWMTSCVIDSTHIDPYAWVKASGEKLCAALVKKGVSVKMIRPYSGYGGDQALSYPFPAILDRAKQKQEPLMVWGSGKQVRDFVHIEDLTDAIIHSIERFPDGVPVEVGTGIGTDFISLAKMMAEEVGYSPEIFCDTTKEESSPRRVSTDPAARRLGWEPKISLREGIRMALRRNG